MADRISRPERSALMARIRGDNLKPERMLKDALGCHGSGSCNVGWLPGRPDVVVGDVAVFVHGCFWHCCPKHWRAPKTRRAAWLAKFEKNRRRDARVRRALRRLGFKTTVVWEHDLKTQEAAAAAAEKIRRRAGMYGDI